MLLEIVMEFGKDFQQEREASSYSKRRRTFQAAEEDFAKRVGPIAEALRDMYEGVPGLEIRARVWVLHDEASFGHERALETINLPCFTVSCDGRRAWVFPDLNGVVRFACAAEKVFNRHWLEGSREPPFDGTEHQLLTLEKFELGKFDFEGFHAILKHHLLSEDI